MVDPTPNLDAGELLEHVDFVQKLARRLARDESRAQDLVQETWLAALEGRPAAGSGMRAWLARVLRNRAALGLRRRERRESRERESARPLEEPDTASLVERMELHQRLVSAVLGLPEAYREVVLRHYLQGESAARIAHHLELPHATVRTRLRRGLDQLRNGLRRETGQQPAAFLAALGTLASGGAGGVVPPPAGLSLSPAAPWAMSLLLKKTILSTVLVLATTARQPPRIPRAGSSSRARPSTAESRPSSTSAW